MNALEELILSWGLNRRGKSPEEALREIKDLSGVQFDPKVVAAFERAWSKDPSWKRRERFLTLV